MEKLQLCVHTDDKKYQFKKETRLEPAFTHDPNLLHHKVKRNEKSISHYIWDENPIYLKLQSDYQFIDGRKLEELAIKLAFLEMSFDTPLFIQMRRRQTADAHIIINFFDSKSEGYFKTNPSTLAFAYGPSGGIGGDITFNADRIWTLNGIPITVLEAYERGIIEGFSNPENTLRTYDVHHTMKHEGMHALGSPHLENCPSCVMFPYYNGERILQPNDKAILHEFYGNANINERIAKVLRDRIRKGVESINGFS